MLRFDYLLCLRDPCTSTDATLRTIRCCNRLFKQACSPCVSQFTPKQTARMTAAWQLYREAAAGAVNPMSEVVAPSSVVNIQARYP